MNTAEKETQSLDEKIQSQMQQLQQKLAFARSQVVEWNATALRTEGAINALKEIIEPQPEGKE